MSQSTDYSFMKTGMFDETTNASMTAEEKSQLLSILVLYMEKAIKIASIYIRFEGRTEMNDKDIILALKSQALDHNDVWEKEETRDELNNLYTRIMNDFSNQNDDVDEDDESQEEQDESQEDEDFEQTLEEKNSFYEKIQTVNERWKDWNPTDPELIILKNAINKTEKKFSTPL